MTFSDLLDALGASSYLAHSICLTGDLSIIFLYVFHDLLTWVSYSVIATVVLLTKGRMAGPSYIGFGMFIMLCGLTHLTKTLVLYAGVYRLDVVVTVATAWISVATASYVVWDCIRWWRLISRSS